MSRERRRQRERRQSGYSSAQLNKPLLPSVFITFTGSLTNETDELRLQLATDNIMKNGCILLMMETCRQSTFPNSAIQIAGFYAQHHDRTSDSGVVEANDKV